MSSPPQKIACPHCQGLIKSPALPAGSQVNCPKCGKAFRLGETAGSQEPGVRSQGSGGRGQPPKPKPAALPPKSPAAVDSKPRPLQPGNAPSNEPLAPLPLPPLAKDGFVSLDAPSSDARPPTPDSRLPTPASRPPPPAAVDLVDPNLLPPPPPRKKPKPTQVAVVCSLCGTRLHAPLEKIGQTIQCPDCHTVNEIKGPDDREKRKSKGPTLDGVEDVELSETVQRPAYRPLQKPRGDYQILSALDPDSVAHGWTLPEKRQSGSRAPAAAGTAAASAAPATAAPPEEEEDEFTIEAPVERVELAPPPIKLPPPDPEESKFDGRYDDELFGTGTNLKGAGWKSAPFRIGVVEMLFQPNALMRWILYGMGAAVLVGLLNFAASISNSEDLMNRFMLIVCSMIFGLSVLVWMAPFASCCLTIVEDTANGNDEIIGWPDYNVLDWFLKAMYFPVAGFITGLPGIVLGSLVVSSGAAPPVFVALAILASWIVLFPLVLCSMLAEGSVISVYSPQTIRGLKVAADAWMLFYMLAFVLGLIAALAIWLASVNMVLISSVGAAALVALAFVYCRLLGRMMWVMQDKLAKLPDETETEG